MVLFTTQQTQTHSFTVQKRAAPTWGLSVLTGITVPKAWLDHPHIPPCAQASAQLFLRQATTSYQQNKIKAMFVSHNVCVFDRLKEQVWSAQCKP